MGSLYERVTTSSDTATMTDWTAAPLLSYSQRWQKFHANFSNEMIIILMYNHQT